MKKITGLLLIFCSLLGYGQRPASNPFNKFCFAKEIDTRSWEGSQFRYELAVRPEAGSSLDGFRIFPQLVQSNGAEMPAEEVRIETRQEQDWTVYTVIGRVPLQTTAIRFYVSLQDNRQKYYFDDVSCYMEDRPAHWVQLRLENPSFELHYPNILAGYTRGLGLQSGMQADVSSTIYKTGRQSLCILPAGKTSTAVARDME